MNWIEITATIFGLICVVLTIRQNIWCWPTGLVQVVLYIFVFYQAKLYSDFLLHVIYVILQFYGWYQWLHGGSNRSALKVTTMHPKSITVCSLAACVLTGIWGYLMQTYTDAALAYFDALIAVVSLFAQWLLARKKLEAWIFWIIVDIVAILVFLNKQLYFTTGLYAVFLLLAIKGYFTWRNSRKLV